MNFTNWQIVGIVVLVLGFLLVVFTAIWLVIKYMRDYKD